jgi:hypothetical protein
MTIAITCSTKQCLSSSLTKKTKSYITEMGLTGAGIMSEDQINMNENNAFTNKWGALVSIGYAVIKSDTCLSSHDQGVIPVALGNEGID